MDCFIYSKAKHHLKNIPIIEDFQFIWEFGHERYKNIRPRSLKLHYNNGIELCYVKKGRYNWWVEGNEYSVYPGEGFITCPWEYHGSTNEIVDIGEIYWLIISPEFFTPEKGFFLGKWSSFSNEQNSMIAAVLCGNNLPILEKGNELKRCFIQLNNELITRDFGYEIKIKSIIEGLILKVVRMIRNRKLKVEKENDWMRRYNKLLQSDITRNWTIEEISSFFRMGTTTLNDKVKRLTGFTPKSYLINLRIDKTKKELTETNHLLTRIALDAGFYSSQHFSSTFLKRVGMTPTDFRKKFLVKID